LILGNKVSNYGQSIVDSMDGRPQETVSDMIRLDRSSSSSSSSSSSCSSSALSETRYAELRVRVT
jgi:hypothetical protein